MGLLGRCHLKTDPADLDANETALEASYEAGSRRKELFDDWCEVLAEKEDWNGLLTVCEKAEKTVRSGRFVYRQAVANNRLGSIIFGTGNLSSATTLFLRAGRLADQSYHFGDAAVPTEDIKSLRKESFESAIALANRDLPLDQRGIEVFAVAAEAFECYVRSRFVLEVMTGSVTAWALHVAKQRETYDNATHAKFDEAIGQMSRYLSEMKDKHWIDDASLSSLREAIEVVSECREEFAEKQPTI